VTPIKRKTRTRSAGVLAACALASIGIAACGGSGSSKNASANVGATSTSASTTNTGPAGGAARFAAMRSCLQKEGITLPQHQAFQHSHGAAGRSPGSGFPGGSGEFGRHLPKGVSAAKLQSALKKCGGDFPGGFRGGFHGGRGGSFKSAKAKTALTAFAACMRENGIKLPAPNTSGQGPVFDTKGLHTSSSQFKSAVQKCRGKLPGPIAGQGGPPPSGGA
jgi:hypothetical protein